MGGGDVGYGRCGVWKEWGVVYLRWFLNDISAGEDRWVNEVVIMMTASDGITYIHTSGMYI